SLMEPVRCEIQVRTLLQHAWGELTHEDTYKPGVKVPELIKVLSKRLATTLAVLDEIAQDLRNELVKSEGTESQIDVGADTLVRAEAGAEGVKGELQDAAEEVSAREAQFSNIYPQGRETLGTVVHLGPDYALIQLPEGDTGILHVTGIKVD